MASLKIKINDEPVLEDCIGHYGLVQQILHTLLHCHPPYVIGMSGSWGSGKTSFLRKLWASMGGEFQEQQGCLESCISWFEGGAYETLRKEWHQGYDLRCKRAHTKKLALERNNRHGFDGWQVIWFNPWQHQGEENPLVALLHEIRAQYSQMQKISNVAGKLGDVAGYAVLDTLGHMAQKLSLSMLPKIDIDKLQKRGETFEQLHYETPLTSQTFRDYFEEAVNHIVGSQGRLLICIDDLDRCEGTVAYRVLESLKLYLNTGNCIFVIGMDQEHLEKNIVAALPAESDRRDAREYLNKMLQDRFTLPVPRNIKPYLQQLLSQRGLEIILRKTFGEPYDLVAVVDTLNDNLPHNPRKIKLFLAGWDRHLRLLERQPKFKGLAASEKSWQLSIVLSYLAIFEEPIYRNIERSGSFYSADLLEFVKTGNSAKSYFSGLQLPPLFSSAGEISSTDLAMSDDLSPSATQSTDPSFFWIAPLVNDLGILSAALVESHLIDSWYSSTEKQEK